MKILITTDVYTVKTNGVVTSVKNLASELSKKGHDVRVLTLSESIHSYKEGSNYFIGSLSLGVVYPEIRMTFRFCHRFIKELISWKPDVVHSQCEFFSYQFAKKIAKASKAPLIHTYHTLYEQYVAYITPGGIGRKYIVSKLSKKRLQSTDVIIAPTGKVKNALISYGIKNKIEVIPTGIDIDQHIVRIEASERYLKRQKLGISDDAIVLINLGRLGNEKNLKELIKFYADASRKRKNLYFLVVGDGPAKDDLMKLSRNLGLDDKVVFTGMVDPKDVHLYYQIGDIFVSASTSETQGLTYVEAAANGLPLLCRKDVCLEDVLIQGENGYEYTNFDEFVSGLDKLATIDAIKEKGHKSEEISKRFDKSSFANSVEKLYNDVLKNE